MGEGESRQKLGSAPGVTVRQKNPDNFEYPFSTLEDFLTDEERVFVRSHFEVPELDPARWRVDVGGAVERPYGIRASELTRLPSRTVTALLECAGNGRVYLDPPIVGVRWELGGVSCAEWTGVPLSALLERAGVKGGAVEVLLVGADRGTLKYPEPTTPGEIPFARSLPLEKAMSPEVLVAWAMNGRELRKEHGRPLRVIVPGWYGMASVKWLGHIAVLDRPYRGYFQTFMYAGWDRRLEAPDLVQVGELEVKSQIARPSTREVIPAGSDYRIFGAAWTGEADVTRVEVSVDGGLTWSDGALLGPQVRYAWRLWEKHWTVPRQPGMRVLMSRATDSRGRVQPMTRDPDRGDSMVSHVLPIEVEIRG